MENGETGTDRMGLGKTGVTQMGFGETGIGQMRFGETATGKLFVLFCFFVDETGICQMGVGNPPHELAKILMGVGEAGIVQEGVGKQKTQELVKWELAKQELVKWELAKQEKQKN